MLILISILLGNPMEVNYYILIIIYAVNCVIIPTNNNTTKTKGVYVPTLALRTLQGNANEDGENNPKINLKAFAAGNGVSVRADIQNSKQWYQYTVQSKLLLRFR